VNNDWGIGGAVIVLVGLGLREMKMREKKERREEALMRNARGVEAPI